METMMTTLISRASAATGRLHAPTVLTAVALAGTVVTAITASAATVKAEKRIRKAELPADLYAPTRKLTTKEKLELVWPLYIPTVVAGVVTAGCMVTANRANAAQIAGLASVAAVSEKTIERYRGKLIERFGEGADDDIREQLARERIAETPPAHLDLQDQDPNDTLCFEELTGRYFRSTVNKIERAVNEANHSRLQYGYVGFDELVNRLNMTSTRFTEQVGWNTDRMIEPVISAILTDDGTPCVSLGFRHDPVSDYHHFN